MHNNITVHHQLRHILQYHIMILVSETIIQEGVRGYSLLQPTPHSAAGAGPSQRLQTWACWLTVISGKMRSFNVYCTA